MLYLRDLIKTLCYGFTSNRPSAGAAQAQHYA